MANCPHCGARSEAGTRVGDQLLDVLAQALASRMIEHVEKRPSSKPQIRKLLYTLDEAALALGRSRRSVEELVRLRKLPVRRNDRRVQIHVRDLEEFAAKDVV